MSTFDAFWSFLDVHGKLLVVLVIAPQVILDIIFNVFKRLKKPHVEAERDMLDQPIDNVNGSKRQKFFCRNHFGTALALPFRHAL